MDEKDNKKPALGGFLKTPLDDFGVVNGGGGGNRTRVRKPSAVGSTCVAGLLF